MIKYLQIRSAHTSPIMAVTQQSRLLALLRELRDDIFYRLLSPKEHQISVLSLNPQRIVRASRGLHLQILRVNKQIKTEGSWIFKRILSTKARFVLGLTLRQALRFLSKLPLEILQSIRSLWIPESLANSIFEASKEPMLFVHKIWQVALQATRQIELFSGLDYYIYRYKRVDYQDLLEFVRDKMQVESIHLSTTYNRMGRPTGDFMFSLAKLLYDGSLRKICLFSDLDPYSCDALPLLDSYDESERSSYIRSIRRSWMYPRAWEAHRSPTSPLVMKIKGKRSRRVMQLDVRKYWGAAAKRRFIGLKPFLYPKSCRYVSVYRKIPAPITQT